MAAVGTGAGEGLGICGMLALVVASGFGLC